MAASPASGPALRLVDWSRLRSHLVWAYRGTPAVTRPRRPRTRISSAWLMLKGTVTLTAGDVTQVVRAGQWAFPPLSETSGEFSANAELLSLAFQVEWPDERPLYELDRAVTCRAADFPALQRVASHLARLAARLQSPGGSAIELLHNAAPLEAYIDLSIAMQRWTREYDRAMQALGQHRITLGGDDPRLARVLARIESLGLGDPFDEDALARTVGLSVSQLNRLFVAAEGLTPRAYFQRRRVRFAEHAIADETTPVKQIAFLLGFRQPSHFSNWFRKVTGHYPRAYRNALHARSRP